MHKPEIQFFVLLAEVLRRDPGPPAPPLRSSDKNEEEAVDCQQHPHRSDIRRLAAIMQRIQESCKDYKFTIYRTAIKIAILQRTLLSKFLILPSSSSSSKS